METMFRFFACFIPSLYAVKSPSRQTFTSSTKPGGRSHTKHIKKHGSSNTTLYYAGAETRIPHSDFVKSWKSDSNGLTEDALVKAYIRFIGQLRHQNRMTDVERSFTDDAVQKALPP